MSRVPPIPDAITVLIRVRVVPFTIRILLLLGTEKVGALMIGDIVHLRSRKGGCIDHGEVVRIETERGRILLRER